MRVAELGKIMRTVAIVLGVLLLLALFLGASFFFRTGLVEQRDAVADAWSQVETELDRRAEVIPALIESLASVARSERRVLDDVAQARAALLSARNPQEAIAANQTLDHGIGRLLVAVENHPQVRSDKNFRRIHEELATIENRIAIARRKYNEALQRYNTSIAMFPNNLAATLFGFERNEAYFRTDPVARPAPAAMF